MKGLRMRTIPSLPSRRLLLAIITVGGLGAVGLASGSIAPQGSDGEFRSPPALERADRPRPIETATTLLGLDETALKKQLRAGQSVAEIATGIGGDPQSIVDALLVDPLERMAAALTDGRVDQATADERLAQLTQRVNASVFETRQHDGDRPERPQRQERAGRSLDHW